MNYKKYIFLLVAFYSSAIFVATPKEQIYKTELRWDWNKIEPIDTTSLKFPKNFLWGVATSAHQVEGDCNCQWTDFEKTKNLEESAQACDHYNKYKEDTQLIKNLGVRAYRFSIEWSKVEPVQGFFNKEVIEHYNNVINELLKNGIMPVITLHHFTHPKWFEELGAFEKERNIEYFVRFAKRMFNEYSDRVKFWCTINEPGVYAFQGYIRGVFPPAKCNVELAGLVSKNLILAHIETFKALKKLKYGQESKIGICHSITHFDPYHKNSIIEEYLAYYLNHAFYDAIMQFFITGKFEYKVPVMLQMFLSKVSLLSKIPWGFKVFGRVNYEYKNKDGIYNPKDILDFFGIQPYSHALVDYANPHAETKPSLREGDIMTDMPYCIYPETLYRAIVQASLIGLPIYITENGIADDKDDRRELFIRRYIYAMHKAISEGYDVQGYFYWSLLDNFEWDLGYKQKFGLYEVDFDTQERKLRKGGKIFQKIVQNQEYSSTECPCTA